MRELRLLFDLQGYGQRIDTDEVGLSPDGVNSGCASVGWRAQATFRIDRYGSMLWAVGPTSPPATAVPPPEPPRPHPARFLVSLAGPGDLVDLICVPVATASDPVRAAMRAERDRLGLDDGE